MRILEIHNPCKTRQHVWHAGRKAGAVCALYNGCSESDRHKDGNWQLGKSKVVDIAYAPGLSPEGILKKGGHGDEFSMLRCFLEPREQFLDDLWGGAIVVHGQRYTLSGYIGILREVCTC